jgi:uncharacterized protein YggE
MPSLAVALAITATVQLAPVSPALAQASEAAFRTTTLNLSAQGEVRVRPDIVTLSLGATSEAPTAQAASADSARRVNAIVQALRAAGVAQRDIQTQWVQLVPKYSDRSNAPRQIVAHEATTTMTVTVRAMDRAGALLDLAVGAGANVVQGVRFGLADPSGPQRQARDQALRALQDDAVQVAGVMGHRVVRLVNVNTQAYQTVVTANRVEELVVTGSRIEPGELTVRAAANGVFEIAPR